MSSQSSQNIDDGSVDADFIMQIINSEFYSVYTHGAVIIYMNTNSTVGRYSLMAKSYLEPKGIVQLLCDDDFQRSWCHLDQRHGVAPHSGSNRPS